MSVGGGTTVGGVVALAVGERLTVGVDVGVCVDVSVGVGGCVDVSVGAGVRVEVGVGVEAKVGVGVEVKIAVCVAVKLGVKGGGTKAASSSQPERGMARAATTKWRAHINARFFITLSSNPPGSAPVYPSEWRAVYTAGNAPVKPGGELRRETTAKTARDVLVCGGMGNPNQPDNGLPAVPTPHGQTHVAGAHAAGHSGQKTKVTTMWGLLDQVAEMERRAGLLYDSFAGLFRERPPVAGFWRDMASEERLHALVVAAAREVFPATAPVLPGHWNVQLAEIDRLLSAIEAAAAAGMSLEASFRYAEQLEDSELNTVTSLIVQHAGSGFARLGALVGRAGADRHRDKLLDARRRFCHTRAPES